MGPTSAIMTAQTVVLPGIALEEPQRPRRPPPRNNLPEARASSSSRSSPLRDVHRGTAMPFSQLDLIEPLTRAVAAEGYDAPTPIQREAIPHLLAGRDLVGCARTGTGKTAAFALPLLQRLAATAPTSAGARPIRLLVLVPTRELASQVGESFGT